MAKRRKAPKPTWSDLREESCYAQLASLIKDEVGSRRLLYVPTSGNWGDAMVHQATIQFLRKNAIRFTACSSEEAIALSLELKPHRAALLLGGGFWSTEDSKPRRFLSRYNHRFSKAIVLPSIYDAAPLNDAKIPIVYVRSDVGVQQEGLSQALFCHDMSFFLKVRDVTPTNSVPYGLFNKPSGAATVTDAENIDIAMLGNEQSPSRPLFQLLSPYNEIRTNRVHIAIAGALLGKKVELRLDGSPHSAGLFASSLQVHYPYVKARQD